jgi:hypothetical protein
MLSGDPLLPKFRNGFAHRRRWRVFRKDSDDLNHQARPYLPYGADARAALFALIVEVPVIEVGKIDPFIGVTDRTSRSFTRNFETKKEAISRLP